MLTDESSMENGTTIDIASRGNKNSRDHANTNGSASNDHNMSSKHGDKSSKAAGNKDCNVVNCQNKTNSAGAADGNKKTHKAAPPGYMRAASPSQSDWGDPTHVMKWINNVAPPQQTFRYNNDNDDYDDQFSGQVFNPRGWRSNQQKKPSKSDPDDPLLLPMVPTFTRAFTFSYMPGSDMKRTSTNSTAGKSKKKSSRKNTT